MSKEGTILQAGGDYEITGTEGERYIITANGKSYTACRFDTPKFFVTAGLDKFSEVTPSTIKNKLVEMGYSEDSANVIANQWQTGVQLGTEPKTKQDVEKAVSELSKDAHCGSCPGDPGHEQVSSPLKREELPVKAEGNTWDNKQSINVTDTKKKHTNTLDCGCGGDCAILPDSCPVCGSEGRDLQNNQKDNMSCTACGITYSAANPEIQTHATKEEVLKILKKAEVQSPWAVIQDENGNDVIARIEQPTNIKESEEDLEKELQKK
jgi:hypothetical protein